MIEIKGIDPQMIANNIEPFEPTHPGELLKEEIECRNISQKQLAADMGVSYTVLNDIVNCKRSVNTKFALLCEQALGVPAHVLLKLQADYDMITTKRDKSFIQRLANVRKVAAVL
ncbi:HigA family addiction module antitoxin [Bacteroides heparinolyticus]|uniref:Addiction module antidote protein, HigA family n=2 Tax=Prevotella heparinolytica TaxID=28113 RepID=A0A3P2AA31_9BACE|nr:HigA family addiction module antitoxin [Bacteroides heparinolyticus]MCF0256795.1 HigA family addiction module antidote protein [Bacteroides heparinolyticus]RRD92349.1 addiction module antidote protein, HigA family [Bacteroides heparinolyticus]VFB13923.1 XRE family transcriptional regulator [Bacteroides heparinolyticus]